GPQGGRYLRVGDLAGADAFAVVLDEDVRRLAPGDVAVGLARATGEHPACRKAMSPKHQDIEGYVIRGPVRTQIIDHRARTLLTPEFRHGLTDRDIRRVLQHRRVLGPDLRDTLGTGHPDAASVHQHGPVQEDQQPHVSETVAGTRPRADLPRGRRRAAG